MEMTKEQIESLAKFALEILNGFPELSSFDGFDIQDMAEKHKLLVPQTVYKSCGEGCNCIEVYNEKEFQDGVTCYHIADWLDRAAQLLRAPAEPEQSGAKPANKFDWLYPQGSQSPKWMTWLRSNRSGRG